MKKLLFVVMIGLFLGCSEHSQKKLDQAIANTEDSLNAKLNKLNDTLKNATDKLVEQIPTVKVNIEKSIPISLQWISFDKRGTAKLNKVADQVYSIKGEQTNANNEYLKIDGQLKRIDEFNVSFEGTIITYIKSNNGGVPCEKTGKQVFFKNGNRAYYRLQQMENCAGGKLLDYVDLYDLDKVL